MNKEKFNQAKLEKHKRMLAAALKNNRKESLPGIRKKYFQEFKDFGLESDEAKKAVNAIEDGQEVAFHPERGVLYGKAAENANAEQATLTKSDEEIRSAQTILKDQGFYYGEPDGKMNAETSAAVRRFQIRNGLTVSGELENETNFALRSAKVEPIPVAEAPAVPVPAFDNGLKLAAPLAQPGKIAQQVQELTGKAPPVWRAHETGIAMAQAASTGAAMPIPEQQPAPDQPEDPLDKMIADTKGEILAGGQPAPKNEDTPAPSDSGTDWSKEGWDKFDKLKPAEKEAEFAALGRNLTPGHKLTDNEIGMIQRRHDYESTKKASELHQQALTVAKDNAAKKNPLTPAQQRIEGKAQAASDAMRDEGATKDQAIAAQMGDTPDAKKQAIENRQAKYEQMVRDGKITEAEAYRRLQNTIFAQPAGQGARDAEKAAIAKSIDWKQSFPSKPTDTGDTGHWDAAQGGWVSRAPVFGTQGQQERDILSKGPPEEQLNHNQAMLSTFGNDWLRKDGESNDSLSSRRAQQWTEQIYGLPADVVAGMQYQGTKGDRQNIQPGSIPGLRIVYDASGQEIGRASGVPQTGIPGTALTLPNAGLNIVQNLPAELPRLPDEERIP